MHICHFVRFSDPTDVVVSTDESSDYSSELPESDLLERLEHNAITITKSFIQTPSSSSPLASTSTSIAATQITPSSPPSSSLEFPHHFSSDQFDGFVNVNSTDGMIDEMSDSCGGHNMLSPENTMKASIAIDHCTTSFEGVLQIQNRTIEQMEKDLAMSSQQSPHQMCDAMAIDDDGTNLIVGRSMTVCDESSDSTTALADCSGDNSADTAVEDLEPTIQNLDLMEGYPEKFTDPDSYLIESAEIGGSDSIGTLTCF